MYSRILDSIGEKREGAVINCPMSNFYRFFSHTDRQEQQGKALKKISENGTQLSGDELICSICVAYWTMYYCLNKSFFDTLP